MDIRKLPPQFTGRMKEMLGDKYDDYLASCQKPALHGLRVNTLKIAPEAFEEICPFTLEPIPWIRGGYYVGREDGAGRHPFYYAGLYYLQEPSAMTPAQVLTVKPGDRVLDLCAAPGGKSTALGAALQGEGLLVSNDISASRCRALLKNIEVSGIPNAVITNEIPARLAERFPEYFDCVLVDAPCSGEGMFRKDEAVVRAWYPEKNGECAKIQKDILVRAADMLREGGRLLYSTCTFSVEENEEVIAHLLKERPQMRLIPIPAYEGFGQGIIQKQEGEGIHKFPPAPGEETFETSADPETESLRKAAARTAQGFLTDEEAALCVRIWPHRMEGEGHFLALLCKGEAGRTSTLERKKNLRGKADNPHGRRDRQTAGQKNEWDIFSSFFCENRMEIPGYSEEKLFRRNDQLFMAALPEEELKGIRCIRNGLLLGELKKGRFEPSQALAMALSGTEPEIRMDLAPEDERVLRYLRGESLVLDQDEPAEADAGERPVESHSHHMINNPGWKLITVSGYSLGWAKLTGNILKNKYLAGWRMQ